MWLDSCVAGQPGRQGGSSGEQAGSWAYEQVAEQAESFHPDLNFMQKSSILA